MVCVAVVTLLPNLSTPASSSNDKATLFKNFLPLLWFLCEELQGDTLKIETQNSSVDVARNLKMQNVQLNLSVNFILKRTEGF